MEQYADFTDVSSGYWAAEYIRDAAIHGWIKGYGDGTFRATQEITRAEVVTIVNRLLDRSADQNYITDTGAVPVSNGLSDRISKDLKKRGFKYVGAITIYSHLQACGIINDHDKDCPCGQKINETYPTVRKRRDHEVK